VDGDALTYLVVDEPAHGVLSGIAPDLTYIPDPSFCGLDNFTFMVNDGLVDSNLATISITVMNSVRAEALVLVNSTSQGYPDFQHYIKPYLDHFGIPYTVLDIANTPVGPDVEEYAVIIVGHRQLDNEGLYLDTTGQGNITAAVSGGTGLVNFDNDLSAEGSTPRYQFVQEIFGFGYTPSFPGSGVTFTSMHYITDRHQAGESISTGSMTMAGITLPDGVTALVTTGSQPFLASTMMGQGRAVQWGSYDWMSHSVKGPMYGLDDLVWRSIVWAARKPFVMQGLPPFVTMLIHNYPGPFWWIPIANEFGIKPWAGLLFQRIYETDAAELAALVNGGQATAAISTFFDYKTFFYFDGGDWPNGSDWPDATMAAHFAEGTQWHLDHNIPISKFVLPHNYEIGTNAFQGLKDWGVEFVGTLVNPGDTYGAGEWIMNGPYRLFESRWSTVRVPVYYADFITIPGHPELDGIFFNCLTEIRDIPNYYWAPSNNDVAGSIEGETLKLKRALDSMALATIFVYGGWPDGITPDNWHATLQGITKNITPYNPIYVTRDEACQYARAMHTSDITATSYDPESAQITVDLGGETDMDTMFYLFYEQAENISHELVNVPTFSGSATVNYSLPQ
jgi:hypothetical protein